MWAKTGAGEVADSRKQRRGSHETFPSSLPQVSRAHFHPGNLLPPSLAPALWISASPDLANNRRWGVSAHSVQVGRTKHIRAPLQVGHCSAPRPPLHRNDGATSVYLPEPMPFLSPNYPHGSCPCSDNCQNRHLTSSTTWETPRFQLLRWFAISTSCSCLSRVLAT